MAYTLWSQDIFTKGELSPFMYARCTVNEYQNGLRTAQNVLTYPTGAAGKRFGTLYNSTLNAAVTSANLYFQTWQYLNECVYQLVFYTGFIDVYLEGLNIATITTSLDQNQIFNISSTVIGNIFRLASFGTKPYDLTRTLLDSSHGNTINGFTSTTFSVALATLDPGFIYPVTFSVTGGSIIQTSPQISTGVTYFIAVINSSTAALFSNSKDAKNFIINQSDTSKAFIISGLGTGTTKVIIQNTFVFANTTFKNVPVYDFNGLTTSYDSLTFTSNSATGNATITVSGAGYPPLDSSYVGGAFIGGGGSSRITAVASNTSFTVSIQIPFSELVMNGTLVFLAEPAWSDARGWPQVCSSYQNRALFANTASLPNGFYASVINDYNDFGDLTTDDDDAISWYPTSNDVNFIRFIVPYRSITVHTNTGIYSSPLSDVVAITPNNFTLQLQDSTPADVLNPVAVDNQILVLSGNDAHQMLWDGINNAYTSDIVSVINEQTIRSPVDETAFQDLTRAGSRFVFIVNQNGSLAAFQTLISQNVSGLIPQIMEQSYGNASFIQAASSSDGRCWFVCKREIAQQNATTAISGFVLESGNTPSQLIAIGSSFSTTTPTAIKFTTSGTLPATDPALVTSQYYWAVGIDTDHFVVYNTLEDAIAETNAIAFTSAGTSSNVVSWTLTPIYTLEELTKDVFLDCAIQYAGSPTTTMNTGILFNAQDVKMVGDGFGFDSPGEMNVGNQVVFNAHGVPIDVSNAYIGFPINTIIEPMPLSIAMGGSAKSSNLTKPKHIRFVNFMFNQTIGGTINGVPIALNTLDNANIGEPPQPASGIFQMSIMKGWDDFNNPTFTIEHSDPFNMILLGAFYAVEI